MDSTHNYLAEIAPRLIQRKAGGWLAISSADSELRLGVTAGTEIEAREKFERSVNRIISTLVAEYRDAEKRL